MAHIVDIEYNAGMSFKGHVNGHEIILDAEDQHGGDDLGPRPKPLLLLSLIGCTGMDVVSLLHKMRVRFEDVKVSATGELTEEHPRYYNKIHLKYEIWGEDLDKAKIEKAVSYSQDRYCGVTAMLEVKAEITFEIEYHES
jgi:putative redox protein